MKKSYLLFIMLLAIGFSSVFVNANERSVQDENISLLVEINERNIADAQNESAAIIIEDEELKIFLEWDNLTSLDIKVNYCELVITVLDLEVYSSPHEINEITTAYSTSNHTYNESLEALLRLGGLNLATGVYKLIFRLTYQTLGGPTSTHVVGMPFYIKIGNLLTSIVGIGAIAVTVISGVTVIGAATGIGNTIGAANFINGVGGSAKALGSIPNALRFSPTDQMPSLIKSTDVSKATLKRCFESGLKQWDGKICPNCKSKWPLRERACKKCGTTRKVATKLFGEKVSKLTVKSFKPIKKTTVGLSLKALERLLSISTPAAHCVLKTLVDVGMVRAKISPWFVTKKLIVNGMKILATILVMLQVTGLKVVGINLIILTVVLGAAVSSVVGFTADKSLTKMKEKMK